MITEEEIIKIVADGLAVEDKDVTIDSKASDIPEWDSLGHLSVLSKIQETLGDRYQESEELASAVSVKEILQCLNKSDKN